MFPKYERKSDRVKSVSFHPTRPLLLSALHSGIIELIDYRMKQRLSTYEDHEGAVRAIQFHPHLSLFCSGGDDFTVRVWNYKSCQFILKGHLDYVRCVDFHPTQPWVLSGSDDQTARVWNYQSRQTIAILTGHTHYIMSCHFHPKDDYIITCSLDQTARLWNYSVLKQRYAQKKQQEYVLSGAEVNVIQIMDGHKDQLNWCAFHPTQPFIITAADDKKIKIWKYNDQKAWEFDTLTGHQNNVCCVVFHQKEDVIISVSEDHTIRIWDFTKRQELISYENKNYDRYWIVNCHSDNYYFACGSDSMLQVFSLYKDRIPICLVNDKYLCVGEKKLIKVIELNSNQQQIIKDITSTVSNNMLEDNVENIEYNQYDTQKTQLMIRCCKTKGIKKHFLLVFAPQKNEQNLKPFSATNACFVGKNKIAKLNSDSILELYNYETDHISIIQDSFYTKVFPYPGGKILAQKIAKIELIDPLTKQILNSIDYTPQLKSVQYTDTYIALISNNTITLLTRQLIKIIDINEPIHIKSLIFMDQYIIYTTKSHLKYALFNGDSGLLKSTENILYLAKAEKLRDNQIKIIAMDGTLIQINIDIQEIIFKLAVQNNDLDQIRKYVEINQNESTLAYLNQKQIAHVALKLVKDSKARFSLSIDSGQLEMAYKIATELKEPEYFELLRQQALRQGNPLLADVCDQQLNKFDRLGFLYMTIGAMEKLQKIQKINQTLQNNLFLGNLEERINMLKQSQPKLATLCAALHGFNHPNLDENQQESLEWVKQYSQALVPPVPIIKGNHDIWPLNEQQQQNQPLFQDELEAPIDQWGLEEEIVEETTPTQINQQQKQQQNKQIKQIDKSIDKQALIGVNKTEGQVASVHFAAGDYQQGIQLLEDQINLTNKVAILNQLRGQSNEILISQIPFLQSVGKQISFDKMSEVNQLIKLGYKYTTEAKFGEVTNCFQLVLQKILVMQYNDEIPKIMNIAKNYLLAMRCDQLKQSNPIEMACKMATIDLSPQHRILTLRQALNVTYKAKQFVTCAQVAGRLIELLKKEPSSKPEVLANAQKYEKQALQINTNTSTIEFKEDWLKQSVTLSSDTMKCLEEYSTCPLEGGAYERGYKKVCTLCGLCKVGEGSGWKSC